MELRQLRYFLSAIQTGGIGAAAESHYVTQPAVSLQLKKLEEELGEKLFVRRGRRIVPTQAGLLLAEHAERVLNGVAALESAVIGLKGLESGQLSMGNIDAASIYVLPALYRLFHQKYPRIKIKIIVGDTARLLGALALGEVELATTTLPVEGETFETTPIYRDEMVLVANPKHELVGRKRVTLEDVGRAGLITYPRQSTTWGLIERVFFEHNLSPNATMEIASPEAMKRLTQAGLGASILPRPVVAAEVRRGVLKVIPVRGVRFQRGIGMVTKRGVSLAPPARAFLEMVKKRFPRIQID